METRDNDTGNVIDLVGQLQKQRVAVAREVLKLLDLGWIRAMPGMWVEFGDEICTAGTLEDLKSEVYREEHPCSVCADGALFVAHMVMTAGDKQKIGWSTFETMTRALEHLFPLRQLQLIDMAFELGEGYWNINFYHPSEDTEDVRLQDRRAANLCHDLGIDIGDKAERMRAIMNNIIANHGEFKP